MSRWKHKTDKNRDLPFNSGSVERVLSQADDKNVSASDIRKRFLSTSLSKLLQRQLICISRVARSRCGSLTSYCRHSPTELKMFPKRKLRIQKNSAESNTPCEDV